MFLFHQIIIAIFLNSVNMKFKINQLIKEASYNLIRYKSVVLNKQLSRPIKEPRNGYQLFDSINKLSRAKRFDDAIALVFNSPKLQSTIIWNELIKSSNLVPSSDHNIQLSFKIFTEMKVRGHKPNELTYSNILNSCALSKQKKALTIAEKIIEEMKIKSLEGKLKNLPNIQHYNILLSIYSKRDLIKFLDLYESLIDNVNNYILNKDQNVIQDPEDSKWQDLDLIIDNEQNKYIEEGQFNLPYPDIVTYTKILSTFSKLDGKTKIDESITIIEEYKKDLENYKILIKDSLINFINNRDDKINAEWMKKMSKTQLFLNDPYYNRNLIPDPHFVNALLMVFKNSNNIDHHWLALTIFIKFFKLEISHPKLSTNAILNCLEVENYLISDNHTNQISTSIIGIVFQLIFEVNDMSIFSQIFSSLQEQDKEIELDLYIYSYILSFLSKNMSK